MNINNTAHREKVKEFCISTGNLLGTKSEYLIEKDLYLTIILKELQNTKFHENLVFKGGTCLAKIYLDYHRFSEDLDFTWHDQEAFKGKSTKQIRKICSGLINEIGDALAEISQKYGFDFKLEKHNREYIQLGGSNKLVTFIAWFDSIYGRKSMIKVQINFLEKLEFPVEKKELKPLLPIFPGNEKIYFTDFLKFYDGVNYNAYDIREIACEKVSTLLTRKTAKTRDIVDIYLICKNSGVDFCKLKDKWIAKIQFAVETYKKYKENFCAREKLTNDEILSEDIDHLLLKNIDEKDFEIFTHSFLEMLNNEAGNLY